MQTKIYPSDVHTHHKTHLPIDTGVYIFTHFISIYIHVYIYIYTHIYIYICVCVYMLV